MATIREQVQKVCVHARGIVFACASTAALAVSVNLERLKILTITSGFLTTRLSAYYVVIFVYNIS